MSKSDDTKVVSLLERQQAAAIARRNTPEALAAQAKLDRIWTGHEYEALKWSVRSYKEWVALIELARQAGYLE